MNTGATATSIADLFGANEPKLLGWLAQGPVLALARFLRAAGARDWAVASSEDELCAFVRRAPVGAEVLVIHPRVLARFVPVREYPAQRAAIVEAAGAEEVLAVAIGHQPRFQWEPPWLSFAVDEHAASMDDAIASLAAQSRNLLIGAMPNYLSDDDELLVSAVVGNVSGPR